MRLRILLAILAALILWRIASSGIAAHYVRQAAAGEDAAVDKALVWQPRQPDALYRKARGRQEQDPALAARLLKESYVENPASARPLLALAGIAQEADKVELAAALVEQASRLMPADPRVQADVGRFWASKGDLPAAVKHWSQALTASPTATDELFPILLALAEEPTTRTLLKPIAASPPAWWERFFREVSGRSLDLETVRALFAFRRAASQAPVTRAERDYYVRRLVKEGKITEAYLVWVNGLDDEERAHLGILHNGSFEIEPTNTGFDWHLQTTETVIATTGATAGIKGKKALHLIFKRREGRYQHLYQPLFLDPAGFRVAGRVRTDSLASQGGLKWVVRCRFPQPADLGESERFLGSSEWRDFSFSIQVPEGCLAQEIRLVSAGTRELEYKMTGGIWFDGLSIRRDAGAAAASPLLQSANLSARGSSPDKAEEPSDPLQVRTGPGFRLGTSLSEALNGAED